MLFRRRILYRRSIVQLLTILIGAGSTLQLVGAEPAAPIKTADACYEKLEKLIADRQYDEALAELDRTFTSSPADSRLHYLAARAFQGKLAYYSVLAECQKALANDDTAICVYKLRAETCRKLSEEYRERLTRFPAAWSAEKPIAETIPTVLKRSFRLSLPLWTQPRELRQIGLQLAYESGLSRNPGAYKKYLKSLNDSIKRRRTPRALLKRAYLYQKNEHVEEAVADYSAVVEISQRFSCWAAIAHAERAAAYDDLGKHDLATRDILSLLDLNAEKERRKITVTPAGELDSPVARTLLMTVLDAMGSPRGSHTGFCKMKMSAASLTPSTPLEYVHWYKGEKYRVDYLNTPPLQVGFDGKHHWTRRGDWVSILSPSLEEERDKHNLNMILDQARQGAFRVQLLEPTLIGGKRRLGIQLLCNDCEPEIRIWSCASSIGSLILALAMRMCKQ